MDIKDPIKKLSLPVLLIGNKNQGYQANPCRVHVWSELKWLICKILTSRSCGKLQDVRQV